MDKFEYKVRSEEIKVLIAKGEFAEAVKIADTIDWHRVKSVRMLCTISDLYKINRRFQESKDILLMAYERHPNGRLIVYSLCELSIKMGEVVQAMEYYKEFVQLVPRDTGKYILQYKLYEAQDVSLEERIAVLEEFKKRDYREKWGYELAYLYHRVGLETKCVEECDEIFLWFGEGRYVLKALELKLLHQPLTDIQQKKYLYMKQMNDPAREEEGQEKEEAPEEPQAETKQGEIAEFAKHTQQAGEHPKEDGIKVKTIDFGQYNTMNLQEELAESMKEILEVEEPPAEEALPGPGPSFEEGNIFLQKLAAAQEEQQLPGMEQPMSPEPEPVMSSEPEPVLASAPEQPEPYEEIQPMPAGGMNPLPFRAEPAAPADVIEPEASDAQAVPVEEAEPSAGGPEENIVQEKDVLLEDTKEIKLPEGKSFLQVWDGKRVSVEKEKDAPQTAHGPVLKPLPKPSGFEQMLSQDYDGQISLVVPNKSHIEKQITGQMNISDIMTEWERMRQENEEKRRQEVYKRVEQHTGNMFSEFDEAVKDGVLEQLENTAGKAAKEPAADKAAESKEEQASIDDVKIEDIEDLIVEFRERLSSSAKVPEANHTGKDSAVPAEKDALEMAAAEALAVMEAAGMQETVSDTDIAADVPEAQGASAADGAAEKAEAEAMAEAPGADDGAAESEAGASGRQGDLGTRDLEKAIQEEMREVVRIRDEEMAKEASLQTEGRDRILSDDEKELFGRFLNNKKSREQILHAIETIGMDSYNGNVVITGEEGAGTIDVAKGLIRILQRSDSNFSGKVAKITGSTMNQKDVKATLDKLMDGALIVQNASAISQETAENLNKALAQENRGLFLILEDETEEMDALLGEYPELAVHFDARVDVDALDDHALVEYARQYAEKMEYSIDELGVLALHTRIADMQTSDHEVTIAEVKDLVDDAIYFANKKNLKHFFDILLGKRYDEEEMVILREKDFMHY